MEEKQYSKHIKSHCVSCGKSIPKTWERYRMQGNYCVQCSAKAEERAKDKAGHEQRMKELFRSLMAK